MASRRAFLGTSVLTATVGLAGCIDNEDGDGDDGEGHEADDEDGPSLDRAWKESNHWLAENTPEIGNWGGADNADEIDVIGTYDYPPDGNFAYPEGTYVVFSWWDYGDLITKQADRISYSNQSRRKGISSSDFLTAESEQRAEAIFSAVTVGEWERETSTEVLMDRVDNQKSNEQIRYVMIDTKTATDRFPRITEWQGPAIVYYETPEDYQRHETINEDEVHERFAQTPYDGTMVSKLYFDHAAGLDHYRLVHENPGQPLPIVSFALLEGGQVITGEGGEPAVEMNRILTPGVQDLIQQLEKEPQVDVEILSLTEEAPVKTYERVEGATVMGSVDPDTIQIDDTVLAYGTVKSNSETNTFAYSNDGEIDADGNFEVTVPYASENNITVEDGYTDTEILLDGELAVGVGTTAEKIQEGQLRFDDWFEGNFHFGETSVPESAVVHGEEVTVDVQFTGR